eukprot:scaffold109923_cov31-Attheya_sp.AAC.1
MDGVNMKLAKWNGHAPSLKDFKIEQQAAFSDYVNPSNKIPLSPEEENSPSLLLHDLENDSHKENAAYEYID